MPRAPLFFLRVASALVGSAVAFVVGEAGARALETRHKAPSVEPQTRLALLRENPHGTGSYRLRPDLDARTRVEGLDVRVVTNAAGMHWKETPVKKRAGLMRVALLGDSFAFGCWARDVDRSFGGVLNAALAPVDAEVLNFGVGGYGLEDEILIFREEAQRYSPDLALVALFVGNDMRDTWLGSDKETLVDGTVELRPEVLAERVPPRFLVADDARSRPADPRVWARVAARSALFRLAAPLMNLDSPFVMFEPNRRFVAFNFWSRTPMSDFARSVIDHYLQRLDALRIEAAAGGARIAVVLIPTSDQVYAINPVGPRHDIRLPQAALAPGIRALGIPVLDPLEDLRRRVAGTGEHLYWRTDSHFNELGHRVLGERLAKWVVDERLLAR